MTEKEKKQMKKEQEEEQEEKKEKKGGEMGFAITETVGCLSSNQYLMCDNLICSAISSSS